MHLTIKFTTRIEQNASISFLDLRISKLIKKIRSMSQRNKSNSIEINLRSVRLEHHRN